MTVPAVVPSAAIAEQASATATRGERSRRQSMRREGSTGAWSPPPWGPPSPPRGGFGAGSVVAVSAPVMAARQYVEAPTRHLRFSGLPRARQRAASASLNVALGRITAAVFSLSGAK